MDKELTVKVELDELNLIFKALGQLPFNEVYELIGKLNQQANEQLQESTNNLQAFAQGKQNSQPKS